MHILLLSIAVRRSLTIPEQGRFSAVVGSVG